MIVVGGQGDRLLLMGILNEPMTKPEAIVLAAKLAVMAGDENLEQTKEAATAFMRGTL